MDPEIALANAALLLLEKLSPIIEAKFRSDPVLAAEQAETRAKFNALRNHEKFTGPEWDIPVRS